MGNNSYTWSDTGNLLSDGVHTYSFDSLNRLTSVTDGSTSVEYAYNGRGDMVEKVDGAQSTQFTLDLASGLTQILSDGTTTYLYGNARLGQESSGEMEYFLTDALGSVRQLADDTAIILVKEYEPYGEVLAEAGSGSSDYGYTGEWTSPYNEFVYLRARWYAPVQGRFLTRDTWRGSQSQPMSYNGWLYAYGNPVIMVDPYGKKAYNRLNAVSYAVEHDLHALPDIAYYDFAGQGFGTDCTSFISQALAAGGLEDHRLVPPSGEDLLPGYWNPAYAQSDSPWGENPGKTLDSWIQTPALYDFLINVKQFGHLNSAKYYQGQIPTFLSYGQRSFPYLIDPPNSEWSKFLNAHRSVIQEGDVVFYKRSGEADWGHAALVVGWGNQTFFDIYPLPSPVFPVPVPFPFINYGPGCPNYLPYQFPDKPLVVERSGSIEYLDSRSIDNTASLVIEMDIVHIPDNDPTIP